MVVALPEDMLVERISVPDAPAFEPIETWPGATDMSRLQKLMWPADGRSLSSVAAAGHRPPAPPSRALPKIRAAGRNHVRHSRLFDPLILLCR